MHVNEYMRGVSSIGFILFYQCGSAFCFGRCLCNALMSVLLAGLIWLCIKYYFYYSLLFPRQPLRQAISQRPHAVYACTIAMGSARVLWIFEWIPMRKCGCGVFLPIATARAWKCAWRTSSEVIIYNAWYAAFQRIYLQLTRDTWTMRNYFIITERMMVIFSMPLFVRVIFPFRVDCPGFYWSMQTIIY